MNIRASTMIDNYTPNCDWIYLEIFLTTDEFGACPNLRHNTLSKTPFDPTIVTYSHGLVMSRTLGQLTEKACSLDLFLSSSIISDD